MVVLEGQNIIDVTIQEFGQFDNIVRDVLVPNGLTLSYIPEGGTNLMLDSYGKGNPTVKNFFLTKKNKPVNNL